MTRTCPWWLTPSFDNPLRRLLHDPRRLLSPYVRAGMRVADLGAGMGHFTVGLAELVGAEGRVVAVDLQERQLARIERRVVKAGLGARVAYTRATSDCLRLEDDFDFVLAFWMVHEVSDPARLFGEIRDHLAPGAAVLVAEPKLHVGAAAFAATLALAERQGLEARPPAAPVRISRAVVLLRPA